MKTIVSVFLLIVLAAKNVTAQDYSFKSSLEYGAEIADFFVSDLSSEDLVYYVDGLKTLKTTVYSAGKYRLKVVSGSDFSAEAEIEIQKKKINPGTLTVGSKIYDGSPRAREYALNFDNTQILAKDRIGVSVRLKSIPYFPSENADTYTWNELVYLSGYSFMTANYELETNYVSVTATIYPRETSPFNFSVDDKFYDGTDTSIGQHCTITIVKGDDDLDFKFAEKIVFPSKNAGTYTLTCKLKIEGPKAKNYRLVPDYFTTEAKILPLTVSMSSFYVADKIYDGTKKVYDYSFSSDIDTVKIEGDDLEIGFLSEPEFPQKNVGKYTVSADFVLKGEDSQNYVLEFQSQQDEAEITPKEVSVSGFFVADKLYDGTTAVPENNVSMPEVDGSFSGDDVYAEFSVKPEYPSPNTGENYLIEADFSLSGADSQNYYLKNTSLTAYSSILCGSNLIHQKFYDVVFVSNYDREYSGYQWFKNGEKLDGETKQFFCDPAKFSGFYQCEITKLDGSKILTCPYYPTMTGVETPSPVELVVYPNPASSGSPVIIKAENLNAENAEIMIFNSKGQLVKKILRPETENEVLLPRGEFSVRLISGSKKQTLKMIVK